MASHTKVVFPPPPPTTNDLTTVQRQQLVRKTKKIEQLLGTTPHFVDVGARRVSVFVSSATSNLPRRRLSKGRPSVDSTFSKSSRGSISSSSSLRRSVSASSVESLCKVRALNRSSHSDTILDPISCDDDKVPFLRLTMSSLVSSDDSQTTDETASPLANPGPQIRHSSVPAKSTDFLDNGLGTVPVEPDSFHIPSFNSVRKQKMDRVRRRLGHDVPLELVFPDHSDTSDSESSPSSTPAPRYNVDKPCPPLPPLPTRTRKSSGRLTSLSNAIEVSSVQRLQPQADTERSAPLPPRLSESNTLTHSELKRLAKRLSLIIESPDEHSGGLVADDDASISRRTSIRASSRTTEWLITIEAPDTPYESSGSPSVSTSSLASSAVSEDGCRSAPTIKKQRSLSYRKPVPPLLQDDVHY